MNAPAYNVVHALRRFVGLRSAWRRSLAMEPVENPAPSARRQAPQDRPRETDGGGSRRSCCCHS